MIRARVLHATLAVALCGCTYSFYDKRPLYQLPAGAAPEQLASLRGSLNTFLIAVDGRLCEPKDTSVYAQANYTTIAAGAHAIEVGWSIPRYTFGRVELDATLFAGRKYAIELERADGERYVSIVEEPSGKLVSNRVRGQTCPSPMGVWGCDPVK
jgi:hypothetical protein